MKNLLPLLIIAFSSACNGATNTSQVKDTKLDRARSVTKVALSDSTQYKFPNKVPLVNRVEHIFSSKNRKDVFTLTLLGDSIMTSVAVFQITDRDNRVLFADTFSSLYFMMGVDDISLTLKQKEDSIKAGFHSFFNENKFSYPAINEDNRVQLKFYSGDVKQDWDEIDAEKAPVGFSCDYRNEGYYYIAFSRKKNKAVAYSTN